MRTRSCNVIRPAPATCRLVWRCDFLKIRSPSNSKWDSLVDLYFSICMLRALESIFKDAGFPTNLKVVLTSAVNCRADLRVLNIRVA